MRFRKTLTLLMPVMGLVFALPAWAQQKPFTQEQVQGLVRAGLGDDSGAKLIDQRGIDFPPAEDFLQSLKAAGASEAAFNVVIPVVATSVRFPRELPFPSRWILVFSSAPVRNPAMPPIAP